MIGLRFGHWTVKKKSEIRDKACGVIKYLCVCGCGQEKLVRGTALRRVESTHCGCGTGILTHDRKYSREYKSYVAMKNRCNNPKATGYEYYGGRGIVVCDQWMESFQNFHKDIGDRPEGTTLDRINTDGNYEPSNCKWSTYKEQANNRRIRK